MIPTLASRCQEIRLRPAPRDELSAALVTMGADAERARTLAALSGGRQGWAVSAVRDPKLYEQQQTAVRELVNVLGASRLGRLLVSRSLSERWSSRPEHVRETLRVWLGWWRDVVLIQLGLGQRAAHMEPDERQALERTATTVSGNDAVRATSALQQSLLDLDTNVNARLVLDLMVLQLPYARM